MDYLTLSINKSGLKIKNKWNSQRIAKKFKNKHRNDYWESRDKGWEKKRNRISAQKSAKLIDIHVSRPKLSKENRIIKQNCLEFEISVNIYLINNENNIDNLKNSKYKLIHYQLQNATINIYDKTNEINYLSYSFIPCNKYCHSDEENNCIYQYKNDMSIPLFVDDNNKIHPNLINLFDSYHYINVNQPIFEIAQSCYNARNATLRDEYGDDNIPKAPQWTVSQIESIENKASITVTSTIKINPENASKFIKSRPFTKRIINKLNIYDTYNHQKIICQFADLNNKQIYSNVPLSSINKHKISLKSLFTNDKTSYDKLKSLIIVPDEEKESKQESLDIDTNADNDNKYWFCNLCFTMNLQTDPDKNKFKCQNCHKLFKLQSADWYYDSCNCSLSGVSRKIMQMVNNYKAANKSECIINPKFAQSFLMKYMEIKRKYGKNLQLTKPRVVYHWTYSKWFDSIKKIGLVVPDSKNGAVHKTDKGFYGKGIYTSPDHNYARCYGGGTNKVFVCLALTGKRYEAHYPQDFGSALKKGYDSHYSSNRNQMEWVFFDTYSLLLLYLIDYTKINDTFIRHLNKIIDCIIKPIIDGQVIQQKKEKDTNNYALPLKCMA